MRAMRVWVAGTAVAIGALAGCAGSNPATPTTAASTSEAARGAEFLQPGLRFSEGAEERYRRALAEVDARLPEIDGVLGYGWTICLDLRQDKTDTEVAANAATRFKVDDATAKEIVEATRTSLCRV
ncbi:hypothetical protein [Actinoplanes xinjiangensis]|uniref:hypothetical protein n=1 Tax=Actinoplanes xinjiangensis TaxID=512350 RepID=UPI00341C4406